MRIKLYAAIVQFCIFILCSKYLTRVYFCFLMIHYIVMCATCSKRQVLHYFIIFNLLVLLFNVYWASYQYNRQIEFLVHHIYFILLVCRSIESRAFFWNRIMQLFESERREITRLAASLHWIHIASRVLWSYINIFIRFNVIAIYIAQFIVYKLLNT